MSEWMGLCSKFGPLVVRVWVLDNQLGASFVASLGRCRCILLRVFVVCFGVDIEWRGLCLNRTLKSQDQALDALVRMGKAREAAAIREALPKINLLPPEERKAATTQLLNSLGLRYGPMVSDPENPGPSGASK